MQKPNKVLTDLVISKFSGLMGGMEDKPSKDKLLKTDIESIISSITPYLPYIGLPSGGVTVSKHVSKHMYKEISDKAAQEPQNETPE